MPEIKFKVSGELEAYFEKIKQRGSDMSNSFIQNAKAQTDSAKEQLSIINNQITALEKKNRISLEIGKISSKGELDSIITGFESKKDTLKREITDLLDQFKKGEISKADYQSGFRERRTAIGKSSEDIESANNDYKEYSKKLDEEAYQEKLQTLLMKQQIGATQEASDNYLKALRKGEDATKLLLSAKSPQEKLAFELAQERFQKDREGVGSSGKSELSKLLTGAAVVGTVAQLISSVGKLTQTKSGFDLTASAEETTGKAIGFGVGAAIGAIVGTFIAPGLGTAAGASAGASAGSAIGGGIGGVKGGVDQRVIQAQMSYLDLQNRFRATTGGGLESTSMRDLSAFGISKADILSSSREYARLSGSSGNARSLAEQAYFAEKGYGVDRGTSNSLIETQRSTNRDNIEIANLVGGILERGKNTIFKGGDQTFLNEFLGKYTTLTKELLKSSNTVASGTTFDILSKFGGMGGQWDTKDPRSMALISSVNQSLSSGGGSDFAKAGNFIALRQANPELDLVDLLMEQQKGLGSKTYLSSVLKQIKGAGGGRSQQILNLAGRLGLSNNLAAAESIYNNQDALANGTMSMSDIGIKTDLSGKAKEFTNPEQENVAKVANALISDWKTATGTMAEAFSDALQTAMLGIKLVKQVDGSTMLFYDAAGARSAKATKTAASTKATNVQSGLNGDGSYNMRSGLNRQ